MNDKIALAMSGGGVRAIAFHAGVLRRLAQQGLLEKVTAISTVSGGSLLAGLVFARCSMRWPTSAEYADVHRALRATLTETDLQKSSAARSLLPSNWRFASSLPNIMAGSIYRRWRIRCALSQLPNMPQWSINCATAEGGQALRLHQGRLGNSEIGYADMGKFSMASAMAMATALPVGPGPFRLDARRLQWRKDTAPHGSGKLPCSMLNIYDGSLHDALGIEPLFDAETCQARGAYRIIVSDAAATPPCGLGKAERNARHARSLMEVMMEQNRALRVRGFTGYLRESGRGSYISLQRTEHTRAALARSGNGETWLSERQAACITAFPASLNALTPEEFDLIDQHGYESALLGMDAVRPPIAEPIVVGKMQAELYGFRLDARDAIFAQTAH